MIDKEKVEFAKQQMNKAIAEGQKKSDVYSKVLNSAKNLDLANYLFKEMIEEDFSCAIKILKEINKEEVKERLVESFFSYLEQNSINEKTITGLFTLGRSYQEKYFLERKELLDELYKIDDFVFDALIKEEEHFLYINYIELCYAYTGIIPYNTEKLIQSDIKTNTKIQEKIKEIEKEMYESEDYNNLFFLATSTNTLENVKEFFQLPASEIYKRVKKKNASPKTCYIAYFLESEKTELEQRIEWYDKNIGEPITRENLADLIVTRYRIRLLEMENKITSPAILSYPKDPQTKKLIEEFTEEEQYDIFVNHAKLFNKTYFDSEKYLKIILEDRVWSPFKAVETVPYIRKVFGKEYDQVIYHGPLIDFRNNKRVQKYLEKEEILKQQAIFFAQNSQCSLDITISLYFKSILHYAISLEEFMVNLKTNEVLRIYNTLLEGTFRYQKEQLYFDTPYGRLKVGYTDEKKLEEKSLPFVKANITLASFASSSKTFRTTNIIPVNNTNTKEKTDELSKKIRRQEEDIEEIKNAELPVLIKLSLIDFPSCIYLYIKNKEKQESLKEMMIELLQYKIFHSKQETMQYYFYQYALGENQSFLKQKICSYIQNILEQYKSKATTDLTSDKKFEEFRNETNLVFHFLQEIDKSFFKDLLEELKNKHLLSITYWNSDSNDYYEVLMEEKNSYIREFYQAYPKTPFELEDIINIAEKEKEDLRLYLYLKVISQNIKNYEPLESKISSSLKEDNRFIEWIKTIDLNIYLLKKDTLLHALKGLPLNKEKLQEHQEFLDLAEKLFVYEEEPIVGNTMKEILQNINYNISDELIEKIKELSSMELTKREKLELAPTIIEVLKNSNCSPYSRLNLLKALGKNNPFNINEKFTEKDFDELDESMNKKINAISALIHPKDRVDLYFLSPQHYLVDISQLINLNTDSVLNMETPYYIRGTVNITNFGEKVSIYSTNVVYKMNYLVANVKDLKKEDYKMIPHYDEILFKIVGFKKLMILLEPAIDLIEEENLLQESLKDRKFYESLFREEKEKVLMHYCRKDVSAAYQFDKEKIISRETYLDISNLLSTYSIGGVNHLYFTLRLNEKEKFYERLLKINRIEDKQNAILKLEKKLVEENNYELFDTLIIYLKEINYLHDDFLLEEAKIELAKREVFQKNYKKYDKEGFIEKSLLTDDLKKYISIRNLELKKLRFSNTEEEIEKYIEKNISITFPSYFDIIYTKLMIYRQMLSTRKYPKPYLQYLQEKEDTSELLNSELDSQKIRQSFKDLKENATTFEDYEEIVSFAKPFVFLKEQLEEMLAEDENLYKLNEKLNSNRESLYYLEKRLQQELKTVKKSAQPPLYNINLIEFTQNIIEKAKQYWKLGRKEELRHLVDFLLKNNISVRGVIHSEEILSLLEKDQKKLVENQSISGKYATEKTMKRIRSYYDLENFLNSKIYFEWKELYNNLVQFKKNGSIEESSILEEIKTFEENLEEEEYQTSWKNILLYKLKEFNLLEEKYILTEGMKEFYEVFISKLPKKEDETEDNKKETIRFTELYEDVLEKDIKKIRKKINQLKDYFKRNRYIKEITFQKVLFEKYYDLYHTSELLYKYNKPGVYILLEALRFISVLNEDSLYKEISLERFKDEDLHSKKAYVIEIDKYLLENIKDISNINEKEILDHADPEYKYYYYLVFCYWKKDYIDYSLELSYNEKIRSILVDFIIITLIQGVDVEEFFEKLKENNILKIMEKKEYYKIYKEAVDGVVAIMFEKTIWSATDSIMKVLKENRLEEKDDLVMLKSFYDKMPEEHLKKWTSYYNLQIQNKGEIVEKI